MEIGFLKKIKETLRDILVNRIDWKTDRKIIVIESDDWGSIRMPSVEVFTRLHRKGYAVDHCVYSKYDALESNEDLEYLIDTLTSVKDKFDNPAKFTINNIVANPDFKKIKESDFQEYYYEPFTETLKSYPGRDRVMELYSTGIAKNVFQPQFHGREHINISRWLEALQRGNNLIKDAFEEKMLSIPSGKITSGQRDYLDAFGKAYTREIEPASNIIRTGTEIFQEIWGVTPTSFIAPCYTWEPDLELSLKEQGILFLQGTHVQRVPQPGLDIKIGRKYNWLGKRNKYGQWYLTRNVFFEPVEQTAEEVYQSTRKAINDAFHNNRPVIISSHRVNYCGSISPDNRYKNLSYLKRLLKETVEKYPDLEFMSSEQLGKLIAES